MKVFLSPLLLTTVFAVSLAAAAVETTEPEPCTVRAWVRAEDLSPDHISRGELRIKVLRPECADQISSVALRLQLDEFGEYKFLKKGAVVPDIYDYWAESLSSDPQLWDIKAEARRGWTTEAILENNPDLSQPTVMPFTVAVPAVSYPPVLARPQVLGLSPRSRHSSSDLGYRYIAVVTFVDGRTEDVSAGHTTFIPSSQVNSPQTPFTWNGTFVDARYKCRGDSPQWKKYNEDFEKCLPEAQRSSFVAEITLEEGNVVQRGKPLRGRVTVHSVKEGLTAMSDISISIRTRTNDHWALAHATAGGDAQFFNTTPGHCSSNGANPKMLNTEEASSFLVKGYSSSQTMRCTSSSVLTRPISRAHPHFDFEINIPHDTLVDFTSYYGASKNLIHISLNVVYSPNVAKCISPYSRKWAGGEDVSSDDAARAEDGMWDMYTLIGEPAILAWERQMTLDATVPITVVDRAAPAFSFAHYLTPGVPAPVLRSGMQLNMPDSFPAAAPVITVEDLAGTSARLLDHVTINSGNRNAINITEMFKNYPSKDYRGGPFAGVLWRKKMIAEERGILPQGTEVEEEGDSQKPFSPVP
ncbi:hypothetical protein DFH08DRAFT_888012 [Mycena albidolilacea]|uniref:Uncharacterized protein n=1 Tax=Mycena albidolilacea TaxID=1033008 RepID=A0AAD6ZGU4_9AGAR|nr:hypothetical protein DFH08DRAFT_888012 [Mycena albidolilacea]